MRLKTTLVNGIPFTIKKNTLICNEAVFLDIETSNNKALKAEDLITWISSIQVMFNNEYYLFRTPEQLCDFYNKLINDLDLNNPEGYKHGKKLFTFIHNSSYDLSYLVPYFIQYLPCYDPNNQGLLDSPNKFLTYVQGALEWRCTYRLTNMSLAKWSNEMNVEHKKQIGLYDYDKTIYQDQDLTESEQIYDKYDILAMKESLAVQNEYNHDTLASMPLTMTGYVRRRLRRSCARMKYYRSTYFLKTKLSPELYQACINAFSGGMTHNNRFYKDMVIRSGQTYDYLGKKIYVDKIKHGDFKSHYPTQMACRRFPVGRPRKIHDVRQIDKVFTIDQILDLYPEYSTISIIRFTKAVIKDRRISIPFMQRSKVIEGNFKTIRCDNGRILKAVSDKGFVMSLDNLTLAILNDQYNLEYEVLVVWKMRNGYLPTAILDTVNEFFKGKSDKKNIVNDLTNKYGKLHPETVSAQFDLNQTKILLNSLYGCCAMQPIRLQYQLDQDMNFTLKDTCNTEDDIAQALDKYYSNFNSFLPFQYGLFVTAYARYELYEIVKAVGYEHILYVDTDSAFYIANEHTEQAIKEFNDQKRQTAKFVDLDNGEREYYDVFAHEPDCIAFKGLHSKCYGVVTDHGLELTIAGVPARTLIGMKDNKPVYYTREDELKGVNTDHYEPDDIKALDRLKAGAKFYINSGVTAIYVGATGHNTARKPTYVGVDGHIVSTAGGCVIKKLKVKEVKGMIYDFDEDIPVLDEQPEYTNDPIYNIK